MTYPMEWADRAACRAEDPELFFPGDEEPQDWRDLALCAEVDGEVFFPDKGGSTRMAKLICSRCPVRPDCLAYALETDQRFGVWGGLSERERRLLRRGSSAA